MGLLRERALHAGRRSAILVGIAWGVPLLLSALTGSAIGPAATRPFLLDLGAWARFFVAMAIFVLMERLVEERLRVHLRQFARAPLLAPGAMPAAVLRQLVKVDGRPPKPDDEDACMDPRAVTLEPLTMLLPDRQREYNFRQRGTDREGGRRAGRCAPSARGR